MGRKLLLQQEHIPGIRAYDVYRNNGGYAAMEKAFKMAPADVIEEVKKSGGIDYAHQKMLTYRDEALLILDGFDNKPVKDGLEELVRFTTDRSY